jgi:hypothetical protein
VRRRARLEGGTGGRLPDPLPKRPYRDSAVVYGALALILVGVAWATGGELPRAVIFGAGFFLVATSWSWWRFHQRIESDRLEAARVEAQDGGAPEANVEPAEPVEP